MKIVAAQCNFLVGDIEGNAERIIQITHDITVQEKVDLIVFPELALSGYPPEDLLFRPEFYKRCEHALTFIQKNIEKTAIIVGYPACGKKHNYNKAACIYEGKIIAEYTKQELPNFTVFDEERYFRPGNSPCVFKCHDINIGLLICEDIWHINPIKQAKNAGAEMIIVINASPFDIHQSHKREMVLQERVSETHLPIIYVNCIGGQDELIFDGGSMAMDAKGKLCQQAPFFIENNMIVDVVKQNNEVVIQAKKIPPPLSFENLIYDALTLGVHDYIHKNHFTGALIGLSGGIDSALTLTIAVDALGAENVKVLIMPSRYTAKISIEDAISEANALHVKYEIISIDALFNLFLKTLAPFEPLQDVTKENIQARIRGMLLMTLSNQFGKIVLNTSNKSELSVGYSTLYGDMVGGFAVLKDISKTRVYQLARYRNSISNIIPDRVLTRAPTAELAPHQIDQDKLPPYDSLDDLLERYIEYDASRAQLISAGFEKNVVDDIVKMIYFAEYKRRQAPIGVRITQRAFGKDRRYPITSGF